MARIIDILEEFLKEMEIHNPYKLVAKGGTALSLFYLSRHRESEDLDFDSDKSSLSRYKEIEEYFINIMNKLKERGIIKSFKKGKSGLAATNRYHMKLELETYKIFQTKIDVDFVDLSKTSRPKGYGMSLSMLRDTSVSDMPENLSKKGELYIYTKERIFITKMVTFVNRNEFKDLYDISKLLPVIEIKNFVHNKNVANLTEQVIEKIEKEDIIKLYKSAFKNVDLRFKDLRPSQIGTFVSKLVRDLRIFKNKIS